MAKQKPQRSLVKNLIYLIVVFLIIGSFLSLYSYKEEPQEIGLNEVVFKIQNQDNTIKDSRIDDYFDKTLEGGALFGNGENPGSLRI